MAQISKIKVSGAEHEIADAEARAQLTTLEGKSVEVDDALDETSTNPVQNKVVKAALDGKANAEAGLPSGGTTGQFLVKSSATDYDAHGLPCRMRMG